MFYCLNRYQRTCWWTPGDDGVAWVRSPEALDKVVDKANCTLAWKHNRGLKCEIVSWKSRDE